MNLAQAIVLDEQGKPRLLTWLIEKGRSVLALELARVPVQACLATRITGREIGVRTRRYNEGEGSDE